MLINFLVQTLQSTEPLIVDFFADKKLKKETSSKVGYQNKIAEFSVLPKTAQSA